MQRIPYDEMLSLFRRILLKAGFREDSASLCARLFADNSRDGVYTHGLNRFPRFIEYIEKGFVRIHGRPSLEFASGNFERWDGDLGPGNLNAHFSMNRAIELARSSGMGCVALRNTNHWMRAGTYGWLAAESDCIGICWTNTVPNMPPWGSKESKLGNNPIAIAVPRPSGHIVLDSAMSMFSYGKLESYVREGRKLPVDGGFDRHGNLTKDPAEIMETQRALPIGFWKGSGLSLALDLVALFLSGGDSTRKIGERGTEYGLSQVFICFDVRSFSGIEGVREEMERVIEDLRSAEPDEKGGRPRYPGESTLDVRAENLRLGIPVDDGYWNTVVKMAGADR